MFDVRRQAELLRQNPSSKIKILIFTRKYYAYLFMSIVITWILAVILLFAYNKVEDVTERNYRAVIKYAFLSAFMVYALFSIVILSENVYSLLVDGEWEFKIDESLRLKQIKISIFAVILGCVGLLFIYKNIDRSATISILSQIYGWVGLYSAPFVVISFGSIGVMTSIRYWLGSRVEGGQDRQ